MEFKLKKLGDSVSVAEIANVHFFEFPENFYTGYDHHPFYELVYVSSGALNIRSEGFTGTLKKNQAIIHDCDEKHSLSCPHGNAPTVIIIGFTCVGLPKSVTGTPTELFVNETGLLSAIIKEGRSVFAPPYDVPTYNMQKKKHVPFGAEQSLKNGLEQLLISLIRRQTGNRDDNLPPVGEFDVKEVIRYLDENFREKITIDELSFIFGTNRSSVCKSFKAVTGKGINEYVNDKKLNEAKRLLTETDDTITEIAERLNFTGIHYFTAFFKKNTGLSPTEYKTNSQTRR